MKNSKGRMFLFMLSIVILLLAACNNEDASNQSGESDEVGASTTPKVIRIGSISNANSEILGSGLGLFEKKFEEMGIEVDRRYFEVGRDLNTAIVSGDIDIGNLGPTNVALGIAQDLPFQVIGLYSLDGSGQGLVVKKDSGINSLKELEGKTIAVPFGSTAHYSLIAALEDNDVDPSKITLLDMLPKDMLVAYKQGQIDGGYTWSPVYKLMMDENGKSIITNEELADIGVYTGDVAVASKNFIENYPDVVTEYVKVMDDAVQFLRSNPEKAIEAVADEMGVSKEEAELFIAGNLWLDADETTSANYLGTTDNVGNFANVLQDTAEFMAKQKAITSVPDLDVFKAGIQPQFFTKVTETEEK